MKKLLLVFFVFFTALSLCVYFFPSPFLTPLAQFLIVDDPPEEVDAVVVLNTGMGIYERLIQAADLYNQGFASRIIINGNRKNDVLKQLEANGLKHCCKWDEERIRTLELFGVPRKNITSISAEDVYDTISEAQTIGTILADSEINSLIITTSRTHTRRAIHIWRSLFKKRFQLISVAAQNDPFSAEEWWKEGRQIKQVLYEYGSWLFLYWKELKPV